MSVAHPWFLGNSHIDRASLLTTPRPLHIDRDLATHRLRIDLMEEGHAWFHQLGQEPIEQELIVRE